jgi:NifU-like protein involved in Fe-S cluster formation
MSAQAAARLYTPQLLGLATQLAAYPLEGEFAHQHEGRSKTCGSTVAIGLDLDEGGRIARIGLGVIACAIGQASAAIMGAGILGKSLEDMRDIDRAISVWLEHGNVLPEWHGFSALEPAREHHGRHAALCLPWKCALAALSKAGEES